MSEESREKIINWFLDNLRKEEEKEVKKLYDSLISHPRIHKVSKNQFQNGLYRDAILNAFIELECMVKERTNSPKNDKGKELSGVSLMRKVFNLNSPMLRWSGLRTQSEKDEYEGYSHIFAGAMQGIRNPKAHKIFKQKPMIALRLLSLADLLARIVDDSTS